MSNNVNWFKVKVGMFDGNSFKRIKRAKIEGVTNFRDKLTAVWFELLDLAAQINNDGYLFNDEIAYSNFEDIAIMLDRSEDEIKLCISWFLKNNMMDVFVQNDENVYMLTNWYKYQNTSGLEKIREQNRIRQRKFRERQKQKMLENKPKKTGSNVTHNVSNDFPLIDIDIEEELDIDKDIDKTYAQNSLSVSDSSNDLFNQFWESYPRKVGKDKVVDWFKRNKSKITEEFITDLIKAIELQQTSKEWSNIKYIPYPLTWLNRGGWNDELTYSNNPKNYKENLKQKWGDFLNG